MKSIEDKYLIALSDINSEGFNSKNWLELYFKLYKLTLIWPTNLPPINRSDLIKGTLREKFNSTYKVLLSEFKYELNNGKQTLEIKSTNR